MPYVKRTASGRIAAVFDRPSRDAKERVRANDPELLRFLGLAPTQSVRGLLPPDAPPVPSVAGKDRDSVDVRPQRDDRGQADEVDEIGWDAEPLADEDYEAADESEWVPEESLDEPEPERLFDDGDDVDEAEDEDAVTPTIDIMDDELSADHVRAVAVVPKTPRSDRTEKPTRPAAAKAAASSKAEGRSQAPAGGRKASAATLPPADTAAQESGSGGEEDTSAIRQLDASDMEMARITEDLIDLLIGRNIINFTDFPTMAQRKLINRRALRSNMSALTNLVSDEEAIF